MLDQQKQTQIDLEVIETQGTIEELVGFRTVADVDGKPYQIADVRYKGAILPVSVPVYELTGANWEADADALRVMLQLADYERDAETHPCLLYTSPSPRDA